MTALPAPLEDALRSVEQALGRYLDRALPRLVALDAALGPAAEALRGFLVGGKRLRPLLLLAGYEASGGRERPRVLGPALALELLHTCALLHDDVIDQSDSRRGRPTVHRWFAQRHREQGLPGDPDHYGRSAAILVGDLALVQADDAFCSAEVGPDLLLAALRHYTVLREEVMAGQFLDLHATDARMASRELVESVATLKSGRYSVARPLELGALLAGADPDAIAGLGRFGDPLGRAFQVRDDLLGVFGDAATTGKSVASDLREGKRTLLVVEALARLPAAEHGELESLLGRADLTASQAQRIRDLMAASGARDAAEGYVREQLALALGVLDGLGLPEQHAATLRALGHHLADRDR